MTAGRTLVASALAAIATMPATALACPICFSGKADALPAYFGTAALLSVLPLAMIGGIIVWFRRQTRIAHRSPASPLDHELGSFTAHWPRALERSGMRDTPGS